MTDLGFELETARRASRAALRGIAMSEPANAAGTRRVQDILYHIAAWEREVTKSVVAARTGATHTLPASFDLDEHNERIYEKHAAASPPEAVAAWEDSRQRLIEAIRSVAPTHPVTCPWGKVEEAVAVATDMIEHEKGHVEKVLALRESAAE